MTNDAKEGADWNWQSGSGDSVQIGAVNRNGQRCCGHRGVPGTDYGQLAYKAECTRCGYVYGANGSDMHAICLKEVDGGRVPKGVELAHAELPSELAAKLKDAREKPSREVRPSNDAGK